MQVLCPQSVWPSSDLLCNYFLCPCLYYCNLNSNLCVGCTVSCCICVPAHNARPIICCIIIQTTYSSILCLCSTLTCFSVTVNAIHSTLYAVSDLWYCCHLLCQPPCLRMFHPYEPLILVVWCDGSLVNYNPVPKPCSTWLVAIHSAKRLNEVYCWECPHQHLNQLVFPFADQFCNSFECVCLWVHGVSC